MPVPSSILEVLLQTARSPQSAQRPLLECGGTQWTYAELDAISSGLASDLRQFEPNIKVAVVCENHPFTFALMFAVWKVGGVFIPIDAHVPWNLLSGMLDLVKPSCLYLAASDGVNMGHTEGAAFAVRTFGGEAHTMPLLSAKYPSLLDGDTPLPDPESSALFLFTSSASARHNLKAVPLTHRFMSSGCASKLAWWRRRLPSEHSLDGLRVLGWAPWSHVLAHMQDIGTAVLLNAGCYVFAATPSTYGATPPPSRELVPALIDAILLKDVTAFACLPFVVAAFKAACDAGNPALLEAIRGMAMFECGGAQLDADVAGWAAREDIPLVVGVGMTELGGAILAGGVEEATSGYPPNGLLPEAELSLIEIDELGDGQLVVKSALIPRGYINYDDGAFSVDEAGVVTFKTGDRYHRTEEGKYIWLGRTTDYIQMASGETLDPRRIERALRFSPGIQDACVVGDAFLNGASTTVCAIIELADATNEVQSKIVAQALSPLNRDLPPAMRIALASVLVLHDGEKIPRTKKGEVFRKKLEEVFGERIRALGKESGATPQSEPSADDLMGTIGEAMAILDPAFLTGMSFAELGMTSLLAIKIAKALNEALQGRVPIPSNICYVYLDAPSLVAGVQAQLEVERNLSTPSEAAPPATPISSSSPTQIDLNEVVIVGKAFRLPGSITTDTTLWAALTGHAHPEHTPIAYIPADRWDHASFYPADIAFARAGLLPSEQLMNFDAGFFGMTEKEAYYLSPTMRLALEVAFEALEIANIPAGSARVKGTAMGVYAAVKDDGFETLLNAAHGYDAYTRFYGTGRAPSTTSGRISYLLDIHGPSVTVDTACSGGLVCIEQAMNYLQSGKGESAIVCSSNVHCWPGSFMFLTAQGMVSPHGRCASFSVDADGYVPSEGAVAFILKTKAAALRDGDKILATIRAAHVSHNGRSQGLVAPNVKAQADAHRRVLEIANLDASQIHFVEAHGTGTSLGDACEIQGINDAFTSTEKRVSGPLIVGASKGTTGHTEPSAGLVGMLSVLLCFEKGLVPGLVHTDHRRLNPELSLSKVPLLLSPRTVSIPAERPYRAVVMSYGFAGTIADVVLESPFDPPFAPRQSAITEPMLFVVSAKSPTALAAYVRDYIAFLRRSDDSQFRNICYTSCVGREHYKHRLACVARNALDLIHQLERAVVSLPNAASSRLGLSRLVASPIFAFSGQGTQFPGMAAPLAMAFGGFREVIADMAKKASELSGFPVLDILLGTDPEQAGNIHSEVDQICIFVFQCAMATWLQGVGVVPGAVVGHSLGEISAAVIAGGFSFELGLYLVVLRAHLLRPEEEHSAGMAALGCSAQTFASIVADSGLDSSVPTISVFNAPQSIAVSGTSASIDTIVATAKAQNIKSTRLKVDQGFHSVHVEHALPGLRTWCLRNSARFQPLRIPLYSTLLSALVPAGERMSSNHWVHHARKPVKFAQTVSELNSSQPNTPIVDIGPQSVAWGLLIANDCSPSRAIPLCGRAGADQEMAVLLALADLHANHGVNVDFRALYGQREEPYSMTDLPTYPFQRVRCYPAYIASRNLSVGGLAPAAKQAAAKPETPAVLQAHVSATPESTVEQSILSVVRDALELQPGEHLDTAESLSTFGLDSIGFARLRKFVEQRFGLQVSIVFWSDAFSIADMVQNLARQEIGKADK